MWKRAALLAVSLLACGELLGSSADVPPPGPDAAGPDEPEPLVEIDGGSLADPTTSCTGDFKLIGEVLVGDLRPRSFRLTGDLRLAVYSYVATGGRRNDLNLGAVVDTPVGFMPASSLLSDLNTTTGDEGYPAITPDGLRLFFQKGRDTAARILVASRTTVDERFGPASELVASGREPYTIAGDTVYFGNVQETVVRRIAKGAVEDVVLGGAASSPVVSGDELTLFVAVRSGNDVDIAVARRAAANVPFGPLSPIPSLRSGAVDRPTWLSPSGCVLLFVSDRNGPDGAFRLYRAERAP